MWTENHINYHKQLSTEGFFEDLSAAINRRRRSVLYPLAQGRYRGRIQTGQGDPGGEESAPGGTHCQKYQNVEEDMEDLISIGCIGLIKAVNSFDSGKGRLATYACRCIDNELLMMLRSRKNFPGKSPCMNLSDRIRKEMPSICWT